MAAQRKSIDCRDYPSEKNCSLKISGTEQEVLDTAGPTCRLGAWTRRDSGIARADQIDAQRRGRLTRSTNQVYFGLAAVAAFHSAHLHLRFGFQFAEQLLRNIRKLA